MPHYLKFMPRSLARNNMAVRVLPGGGYEFDTVEEMVAYQKASGKTQAKAPKAAKTHAEIQAEAFAEIQRQIAGVHGGRIAGEQRGGRGATARAAYMLKPENFAAPVSYDQGKTIVASIGGWATLCGGKEAQEAAYASGVRPASMLTEMGMTRGKASEVIDALQRAGVYGFNQAKPSEAAAAREILSRIGGIACPSAARTNRGSRGRGR